MIDETLLCLVFLVLGIAIGLNLRPRQEPKQEEELPKDIDNLQKELIVYKNLKESLLADIKYWREKATKK